MAIADVNRTVIGIINEVERKLAVNESSFANSTKLATIILDSLNDVITECNDYGRWPHMFREAVVTASASVDRYELAVSAQINNILEIHWANTAGEAEDIAPLQVVNVQDIRRLQKTRNFGVPRQFAIVNVSGVNPIIRVSPIPGANENKKTFDIAFHKKQRLFTTASADTTAIPLFDSRMLVQGTLAKTLLEEAGQESTPQYTVAYQEYIRMRKEAWNRLTVDTGSEVQVTPNG